MPAGSMCNYTVELTQVDAVDDELTTWIKRPSTAPVEANSGGTDPAETVPDARRDAGHCVVGRNHAPRIT